MRMFKFLNDIPNIWLRSNKKISYETIDFNFNPKHIYMLKVVEPTKLKIPNVPYKEQYENRDF